MMLSLLQAEFFKVRRSALIWWSLVLSLAFFTAQLLSTSLLHPTTTYLSLTNILLNMNGVLGQLIPFFMMLFGAHLVGHEYVHDMWKNLLIRQPGRENFIMSKVLTLLIFFVIGLFIFVFFNLGLGSVLQAIFHFRGSDTSLAPGNTLLSVLISSLNPLTIGMVSLMGAVIGRSTIAGVLVALPWSIFDSVMSGLTLPLWLHQLFFTYAYKSLLAHSLNTSTPLAVLPDLLVLVSYLLIPLVITLLVFRRRDIAA